MNVKKNVYELIGHTPILEMINLEKEYNLSAKIYAKIESFNPGGSIKDRIALYMIEEAIKEGKINQDTIIVEPTSGNTGIGLAMVGSAKGLKVIIVMPDTMSIERRQLMKAYGAEIVLTDGKLGMKGAIDKANELANSYPNSFIPSQFNNMNNPKIHYLTTGREIYEDLDGKIDILIVGVGTGGTISGIGKYLKEKNKDIKIIAVEPASSPVLSKGESGAHKIQGIGAGFIPKTLNTSIYDEVIAVSDEDAFKWAKIVARKQSILVGISSGAALAVAIKIAQKDENKNKNIVVIFPDGGEKYLSTGIYED